MNINRYLIIGILIFGVLAVFYFFVSDNTFDHLASLDKEKASKKHNDFTKERIFEEKEEIEREGVSKFDKPSEFLKYHRGIRTRANETAPSYRKNYLLKELKKARSNRPRNLRTAALEWKERGPANTPGRTRAIVVLPNDPSNETWIVGAVGGGIWKTTDAGANWSLMTPDLPSMSISTMAYSKNNPNVIYAGTGEAIGGSVGLLGNGVFKSVNGGETWSQLPSTSDNNDFNIINRIIVHPDNPDTVLLCTNEGPWEPDTKKSKIFKSTDGGASWKEVYQSDTYIFQLVANPGNFNTIYASYWGQGILKSTDLGESWSEKTNGFVDINGRIEIAAAPSDTSWLYASAVESANGSGASLFVSEDAGETWELIDQKFDNSTVDFLGGQGNYDNAVAVNPYDKKTVYYGGVNLWKTTVTDNVTSKTIKLIDVSVKKDDASMWEFINFGADYFDGKLEAGDDITNSDFNNVIVVTGPNISQMAYRFTVGKVGAGVPDKDYIYEDYVEVPFQVWDVDNNTQLMVSFRDQQEDGKFNLINENTADGDDANHSREYVFIHDVEYSDTPDENIARDGGNNIGHDYRLMYFFWPVLRERKSFDPPNLDVDTIFIDFDDPTVKTRGGDLFNVSDAYNDFSGNNMAYRDDEMGFMLHPDHHNLTVIPVNESDQTFQILEGSDGGVFLSNIDADPGIDDGDWTMVGTGYNSGQFYGADKKPGADEFIGGMQDNGTWKSPTDQEAISSSQYSFELSGDGFEVIWNNLNANEIIASSQFNNFSKTTDQGTTWINASGDIGGNSPFISKLANSPSNPDVLFTVTSSGVYKSEDFGDNWTLTEITDYWNLTSFMDIEVSKSNYNIVWAGSGMSFNQKLHVSVDGGETFSPTNNYNDVTLGNLSGLETHPEEDSTAYVLFSFADGPKILRTTDLGQTWEDISGFGTNDESSNGFPDVAVYSLLVRPDDPQVLWAGTEIGIFESSDNGQSWHFLETDFGATAVWQMKVVDDKVVVATHGRGIWTATLDAPVDLNIVPQIVGAGTGIDGQLFAKIKLNSPYDSTLVFVDGSVIDKIPANDSPQEGVFNINGLPFDDTYTIHLEAYNNGFKLPSNSVSALYFEVADVVTQYENDFDDNDDTDFTGNGFSIKGESNFSDGAIHSIHPYEEGDGHPNDELNYYYYLRHPVKVQSSVNNIRYQDVAIVETGENGSNFGEDGFYDYVVVEGSQDGILWEPLADGYDASADPDWSSLYDNGDPGTSNDFKDEDVDLTNTFQPDDTIMIRFRLYSDPFSAGWGWAIDDLKIQIEEKVTGIEKENDFKVSVYPNPSHVQSTIELMAEHAVQADIKLVDLNGKVHWNMKGRSVKKGRNEYQLATDIYSPGIYFLIVEWNGGTLDQKLLIR